MSTPLSPLRNQRASTQQPSEGLTPLQIIFTPGGSQIIKDNLIRVYENRKYRIYGAYVTGVTAVRSGLEIVPSAGKLLLNTATWFFDMTRFRGEVITIFARDFADIIHCIKTTIALPFFAIAGIFFPSEVFGLFKNMPGMQTKVKILDEQALLAQVIAKRASAERNLTNATQELGEIQTEIIETDKILTSTKAELEIALQQIADSKVAADKAEKLKTEVRDLTNTVAKLRSEEVTASASLANIRDEITRLGPNLERAKTSNASALESLEGQHTAKKEELQRIQDQIKLASEKQAATQDAHERLSTALQNLMPTATALKFDVERLESAKPGLIEQERSLLAKIQSHKHELQELEAQATADKQEQNRRYDAARKQISNWQIDLDERQAKLETLNTELKNLNEKKAALTKQCGDLEFTTLRDLNGRKEALGREIESLDAKKATLEAEIAVQQKTLHSAKMACENLESVITELLFREDNHKNKVLPELERQKTALEEQKATLEGEISAEQQKLEAIKTRHADSHQALDNLVKELELKQAEQASLELILKNISQALKGSSDSSANTVGSRSPKKIRTDLQKKIKELGASITESTERDTALKISVASQESALTEKKQTVDRLTGEASLLDTKVDELQRQEREMASRLLNLKDDITKLDVKEKELRDRTASLDLQVRTSTESFKQMTAQHQELATQVRTAEENKVAAKKDFKALSEQVAAARIEKAEIQSEIDEVKPRIELMNSSLTTLKGEKASLDEALTKLKVEKNDLIRKIANDNQELAKLKETLADTKKTHAAEMQKLAEARTQLSEGKTKLENEIEAKKATRDAFELELNKLTASTKELKDQETALKETVRTAEAAQQAAMARINQEIQKHEMLQVQTFQLSVEVQELTQKAAAQAEANLKLTAEFETRRADCEESLRQREQEAIAALKAQLEEIRKGSPAKAKLNSPTRTIASSPETVREDLITNVGKLRKAESEFARKDKALKEKISELDKFDKEFTAYKEKAKAEFAQIQAKKEQAENELAATMNKTDYDALVKERMQKLNKIGVDHFRIDDQVKTLRKQRDALKAELNAVAPASAAATSAKPASVNNGTGTETKQ